MAQLAAAECPTAFWRFGVAVGAASAAQAGAGWLTKKAMKSSPAETRDIGVTVVRIATFWIVAGTAWVLLTKRS